MRAHSRLESRYSNSSGGSYDEEKSMCYIVLKTWMNYVFVIFVWWETQFGLKSKNEASMEPLRMDEQCVEGLGLLWLSAIKFK